MAVRPYRDEPSIWTHRGFLLSEDESLKSYLEGITVPGRDAGSPGTKLGVWFRWPEGERQIQYPFVAIDLLSANPDFDLFTSDYKLNPDHLYRPSHAPNLPEPPEGWGYQSYALRNFWPFLLQYQVAVHSRTALHDRYLQSIFRSDVFPPRPFWIRNVADLTWRRTEMIAAASSDLSETTESGTKRIFRKVYTITMMAEVPQDRILDSVVYRALRVLIPVTALEQFDSYRQQILDNQPTPLDTFTQEERDEAGELFHIWHQGHEMPAPLG